MEIEKKALLRDMLDAIVEIESFIEVPQNFQAFGEDAKTKRAVERNIEIIGEAMSRLLNKYEMTGLSNARKIVDTRNRIIHGYNSVSADILWAIVQQHLPVLKKEIEALLR